MTNAILIGLAVTLYLSFAMVAYRARRPRHREIPSEVDPVEDERDL